MTEGTPNKDEKVIRILLVDDHPVVREGLRALLSREADFQVCGDVGNAADALEKIRSEAPQVAIVDVLLGDESGLDLIRKIKELDPRVRILVCSMFDDLLYAERALAAGAMGYLNKRATGITISEAIRRIMQGEVILSERIKQHIIHRSVASGPARPKTPIETLTDRELEIFKFIGHGLTSAEIGELLKLSAKTVETHRQNIRRHLQLDSTHKLTREAAQWVLEGAKYTN